MTTIGIDLGTTNSLVSVWKDNKPIIIPNVFNKNLTPSVISVAEDNTILVGDIAKERFNKILEKYPHLKDELDIISDTEKKSTKIPANQTVMN